MCGDTPFPPHTSLFGSCLDLCGLQGGQALVPHWARFGPWVLREAEVAKVVSVMDSVIRVGRALMWRALRWLIVWAQTLLRRLGFTRRFRDL